MRPYVAILMVIVMAMLVSLSESKCAFQAIFNFGDSNADTGNVPSMPSPNGMTYFNKPAGRACDGRLFIDFLAQGIGLQFLSPYQQQDGSDYRHGVNFATQGATALQPTASQIASGVSQYSLASQLDQMKKFKAQVDGSSSKGSSNLPPADVFGKSLYVLSIGQNDFTGYYESGGAGAVQQVNSQIINQITATIKELYTMGGRTFMVQNIAPVNCYPASLARISHGESDVDKSGCLISYHNAVVQHNNMLKDALSQLKQQLGDANVIYVDSHAVLLQIFQNPSSHGMKYGTRACCGAGGGAYNYNNQVFCGHSKEISGTTVTASACGDPYNYVSWDGVHTTEAANKILANAILSGSYFSPTFDLHKFCDIQQIG